MSSNLFGRGQNTVIGAVLSASLPLSATSKVQGGVDSDILSNVMACDLPCMIHTNHQVSLLDTDYHCHNDGDMFTFVEKGTASYSHKDPAILT